jgi:hypothetical protein
MHTTKVIFSALAFVGSANGALLRSSSGLQTNSVPTTYETHETYSPAPAPATTGTYGPSSMGAYTPSSADAGTSYDASATGVYTPAPAAPAAPDTSYDASCGEFGIVDTYTCGPTCDMPCKDMYATGDNAAEKASDMQTCDDLFSKSKKRKQCRRERRKARRAARSAARQANK